MKNIYYKIKGLFWVLVIKDGKATVEERKWVTYPSLIVFIPLWVIHWFLEWLFENLNLFTVCSRTTHLKDGYTSKTMTKQEKKGLKRHLMTNP